MSSPASPEPERPAKRERPAAPESALTLPDGSSPCRVAVHGDAEGAARVAAVFPLRVSAFVRPVPTGLTPVATLRLAADSPANEHKAFARFVGYVKHGMAGTSPPRAGVVAGAEGMFVLPPPPSSGDLDHLLVACAIPTPAPAPAPSAGAGATEQAEAEAEEVVEDLPAIVVMRARAMVAAHTAFVNAVCPPGQPVPMTRATKTARACHKQGLWAGLQGCSTRWVFRQLLLQEAEARESHALFEDPTPEGMAAVAAGELTVKDDSMAADAELQQAIAARKAGSVGVQPPPVDPLVPCRGRPDANVVCELVEAGVARPVAERAAAVLADEARRLAQRVAAARIALWNAARSGALQPSAARLERAVVEDTAMLLLTVQLSQDEVAITRIRDDPNDDARLSQGEMLSGVGGKGGGFQRNSPYVFQLRVRQDTADKLKRLYARMGGDPALLDRRLFALLGRYEALSADAGGMQMALPEPVFDALRSQFGVTHECFASPLNCYDGYSSYCSLFFDTDRYFGSSGSSFAYTPDAVARATGRPPLPPSGAQLAAAAAGQPPPPHPCCFEANPPFVDITMTLNVRHIHAQLREGDAACPAQPLAYIIVVPGWDDCTSFVEARSSPYLRHFEIFPKNSHYYKNGLQHRVAAGRTYQPSGVATFMLYLQNEAAQREYPTAPERLAAVKLAFERPLEAGARGGGVASGKRKFDD